MSFETIAETYVWPLDCVAVGKLPAPAGDGSRQETDRRDDARARVGLPPSAAVDFYVTGQLPDDPTGPDALSIDVGQTLDHSLWIAVLGKAGTDVRALANRSLFVGVAFDEQVPLPFALEAIAGTGASEQFASTGLNTDPPAMLWQLWSGPGNGFTVLNVGDDSSRGLTTTGVVELLLPGRLPPIDPIARTSGDKDNPPPLTDEKQAARVLAWLRVSRPKTSHINDAHPPGALGRPERHPCRAGPHRRPRNCSAPAAATPDSATRSPSTRCCPAAPCCRSRSRTAGGTGRRSTPSSPAVRTTGTTRWTTRPAPSSSPESGCRSWVSGFAR